MTKFLPAPLASLILGQPERDENARLNAAEAEVAVLRAENETLKTRVEALECENAALRKALDEADARVKQAEEKTGEADMKAATEKDKAEAAQDKLADATRKDKLHSGNSDKPSSKDWAGQGPTEKQRRTRSQRRRSGLKPGGQPGHKGVTLERVEDPDETVDLYPTHCRNCHASLPQEGDAVCPDPESRQVYCLPEKLWHVKDYRAHTVACTCGCRTKADFPSDVTATVQHSGEFKSLMAYLSVYHHIPEDRVSDIMRHIFKLGTCAATVGTAVRKISGKFDAFTHHLMLKVFDSGIVHMDETGIRVTEKGKRQGLWLHVACTDKLSFFKVAPRGDILDPGKGIVVHDEWKPYFTLENVVHVLCGGHLLRQSQALIDIEQEPWARRFMPLLQGACHQTNRLRAQPKSPSYSKGV